LAAAAARINFTGDSFSRGRGEQWFHGGGNVWDTGSGSRYAAAASISTNFTGGLSF